MYYSHHSFLNKEPQIEDTPQVINRISQGFAVKKLQCSQKLQLPFDCPPSPNFQHYADKLSRGGLMTSFYKPVGSRPIAIVQKSEEEGKVKVIETTINMQLSVNGFLIDMIVPKSFGVRYYMRKEPINPTL